MTPGATSGVRGWPHAVWVLLRATVIRYGASDGPRMGAAFAFYSIFSIVPLIIISMAVAAAIFGHRVAEYGTFETLKEHMGEQSATMLRQLVANASRTADSVTATVIGAALALWGASKIFVELRKGFNDIWRVDETRQRGLLRTHLVDRLVAIGLTFLGGALLLTTLAISTLLQTMRRLAVRFGTDGWVLDAALARMYPLISLLVLFALFAMLFKLVPAARVQWRDVWLGGVVTALLFTAGKYALGVYLSRTTSISIYGAAGSLVVLLVWVYYTSQIVIFGASLTATFSELFGSRHHARVAARPPHAQGGEAQSGAAGGRGAHGGRRRKKAGRTA